MKKSTDKVIPINSKKPVTAKVQSIKSPAPIYELKVTLAESEPAIQRRILVSGDVNLGFLHAVLQIAMGWTNSHLHQFEDANFRYSDPTLEDDVLDEDPPLNEFDFLLKDVAVGKGAVLQYLYDFGDSWYHFIEVENIMEKSNLYKGYPICIDGAGACPPEDCGGMDGYMDLCETMEDPENEEYGEMLEWVGGIYDPDFFDVKETNRYLKKVKWKNPTCEHLVGIMEERFGFKG